MGDRMHLWKKGDTEQWCIREVAGKQGQDGWMLSE